MAVTDSPRLGLTRWSAGTDPLTRLQLDGDHAALDDLAVMSLRGTLANRPAAGVVKRIYEVTGDATASNNGRLFWDTGSAWLEVARVSDIADHAAAADPHPGYATDADLTNHAGASDPHPVYETGVEAQARVDTHENKIAPHSEHPHHLRGTLANRPAAGTPRRIYEVAGDADAANNGRAFYDTGTAWLEFALLDGTALSRTFGGPVLLADGALAAPGLAFAADPDTGLFRPAPNLLDVAAGGALSARFYNNGVQLPNGSPTTPALSFLNDPDTGLERVTENNIHFVTGGVRRAAVGVNFLDPNTDNSMYLGTSTRRWIAVWAVNGTVQTSDVRVKEDVQPIPDDTATERVRRVGKEAAISYRWPDGTRRHIGFDAEQVGVIHGETSAAYIDPTYEADARTNPYTDDPPPEWYADYINEDADADERDEQRAEAEQEWIAAREAFDQETVEIRDAPKGLRPSEMVPDLYAALAKALDRIDQLEERVAALESA